MPACVHLTPCLSCVVSVSSPNTTIFMVQSIKCAEGVIIKHLGRLLSVVLLPTSI